MNIRPLRQDLKDYLANRGLEKKWQKASRLFGKNTRHPSLHTELLEPLWKGIYSFRLDKKYRALYFITRSREVEVFQITNHYKK
ncbi:MAG: hypothetical protein A2758_01695 [Candidatus Zambryskibacteria bacterium RIFCSPHIGHO2_01_FULL_49_18]|uniref:Toxin YoeB n=2 Tax=Candidatus Zambryskiibacteriota TaxID=1817925 RepID=A0A1G2T3K9_9BACT|nr:MAG: hypothetical protein A2758_01695 [Candidatus Zambryskibacteria bacterium RIFCSPHIGHO2_01_FULL_49_18]OHB05208.1 MAG: hypothetical protein A3A26_02825 [Candidatus Zambryskibacteria bacterium RIFCSPLOWO2_01_FULL_47_14]